MDFVTMIARTYDGVRDANRDFITVVEVKAWLNEAQRDLANREKVLIKAAPGVVPVGGDIPVPADLIEVKRLSFGTDDVSWPEWSTIKEAEDNLVQNPYSGPYGRILNKGAGVVIETYPEYAVGSAYTLEYAYEPADLVADADMSPLPLVYHAKMVHYATSRAYLRINEMDHAASFMDLYRENLKPQPLGHDRRVPGPFRMTFEPGPFDRHG